MRRPRVHPAVVAAVLLLPVSALAACGDDAPESSPAPAAPSCAFTPAGDAAKKVDLPPSQATATGPVEVTISTTQGDLHATLDGAHAPCTVTSFLSLADQGYFDSTPCHRLTTEGIYVLQCGDPTGTGYGGPGYTIPDEYDDSESYPAGTLAMANAGPGTGGSQFFIVYEDTQLDPFYTVFGTLDGESTSLVRTIAAGGSTPKGDGKPNTAVDLTGVTLD
ncbi:peptidylprolyl isomerase [Nocardioides sp.]|uniref:peptidylprolyl isomerase n=1 Tax=Nocardioides sp. TaxID=35761 RepID=UPI003528B1F0